MTTLNTSELYPKICRWLGLIYHEGSEMTGGKDYWESKEHGIILNTDIDFIQDYDQLQWIEDKLRELGCDISYCYYSAEKIHSYVISDKHDEFYEKESKESKPLALLQAVEELIKKEK